MIMKLDMDHRTEDPLGSIIHTFEKRWQVSQLASIPEYSDPFFSITEATPTTQHNTLPDILAPSFPIPRTPKHPKRRKYSIDSHVRTLASQIVPKSTKPTPLQELQRSIKRVWEKRFTPHRVLNELYLPAVLYATRDRLNKEEEDYWMRSDMLHGGGSLIKSHDPLEDLSGCGIRTFSVYLKKDTMSRADSIVSSSSSKSCLSKARDSGNERSHQRLSVESAPRKLSDILQSEELILPTKEENTHRSEIKRKQSSLRFSKKSQHNNNHPRQTFERRKTRPEDSMYESIDPIVLNKTKLSKAFCGDHD